MISVKNLHKIYGTKQNAYEALRGVSLDIDKGQSVAIIGKSGSGKSTLMHVLAGLDSPTQGSISLQGKDLAGLKDKEMAVLRNEKFGFVFQQFFLQPNLNVMENVTLPLMIRGVKKSERDKRGKEVLEAVDLFDKARNKATNLSGGQKQRVAIARALVGNPEVIFADEPTGNLDTENGEAVTDLLFKLRAERGITLVIVTHDPDLAARCDRVISIVDGKVHN